MLAHAEGQERPQCDDHMTQSPNHLSAVPGRGHFFSLTSPVAQSGGATAWTWHAGSPEVRGAGSGAGAPSLQVTLNKTFPGFTGCKACVFLVDLTPLFPQGRWRVLPPEEAGSILRCPGRPANQVRSCPPSGTWAISRETYR